MNSSRPYIMRALYEWIVDNECTPYVLVDASAGDVLVPKQFVKDNQIVLNISPDAVVDLTITNNAVSFNGRFGGGWIKSLRRIRGFKQVGRLDEIRFTSGWWYGIDCGLS